MRKISIIISSLLLMLITFTKVNSDEKFSSWIIEFKKKAINEGISEKTVDAVMNNAIFLPKVIEYDRYQPEFYEDTKTYVSKRTSKDKVKKGKRIYKKNKNLINIVDKEFKVEKELLLALMGIETNYGTYLGKMDIISSLATLSYDKRRSEFFSNELITILKLIDQNKVDKDILFGSWAGAFGNFQFMPTTISNYAIDYNNNSIIELKEAEDSFASAANYLNKIGWKKNEPCFFNIELNENIPKKLLNTSAKKIKHKRKFKYFKKYIKEFENLNVGDNVKVAVITPDSDIVKDNNKLKPAYLVFPNYDRVLKWNRSLRFAIAVCTLKNKFENEL
ncbi:lytic murein transglycosylase [Candidatus Pelagibacter communis]|uniref:lytic murein transglycosylase n=1 Tax=Pelagibacter ubique TaxID=198252 RepID=UPI00094D10FB|nr:lytic murein transglycosylase [Candidatus Pelagibacter ubique]